MHRPRCLWLLLAPALFILIVAAAGCGGSADAGPPRLSGVARFGAWRSGITSVIL